MEAGDELETTVPSTDELQEPATEDEQKLYAFVQQELDSLNRSSQAINASECRLDEARHTFNELNRERSIRLDEAARRTGKAIERARPFHEAKTKQRAMQAEVQKTTQAYEKACSTLEAAKELVEIALQGSSPPDIPTTPVDAQSTTSLGSIPLDANLQEVLSQATVRVTLAERERSELERLHAAKAEELARISAWVASLDSEVRSSIRKSANYFELVQSYSERLTAKKNEIDELERQLRIGKREYGLSMRRLNAISNLMHKLRAGNNHSAEPVNESLSENPPKTDNVPAIDDHQLAAQLCQALATNDVESLDTLLGLLGIDPAERNDNGKRPSIDTDSLNSVPSSRSTSIPNNSLPTAPLHSNQKLSQSFREKSKMRNSSTMPSIRAGVVISASELLRSAVTSGSKNRKVILPPVGPPLAKPASSVASRPPIGHNNGSSSNKGLTMEVVRPNTDQPVVIQTSLEIPKKPIMSLSSSDSRSESISSASASSLASSSQHPDSLPPSQPDDTTASPVKSSDMGIVPQDQQPVFVDGCVASSS